ncbi:hypothetical protein RND81_01G084500 [Saponaria officinalis]
MSSIHVLFVLCSCWINYSKAIEKITSSQFLRDSDSIVSNNGDFKLGFFSPSNTTNQYVGIWYNKVSKDAVFWVANRNNPLKDTSGILRVSLDGNLVLLNGRQEILWSSNISIATVNTSKISAQLLDSGNLVLLARDPVITSGTNGTTLWQSFDHPTDSLLPNAKITFDEYNMKQALPSWKSLSDPSIGQFSLGTDSLIRSQAVVYDGDRRHWRSGPWNGNIFLGLLYYDEATNYANTFVHTNAADRTVDLDYTGAITLSFSHYALSYDGILSEKWWDGSKGEWRFVWKAIETPCDLYGYCGAFGTCNALKTPLCKCLKGFAPRSAEEWKKGNWSNGCVRKETLQCGIQGSKEDGFLKLNTVKIPDLAEWSVGLNQVDCRSQCLKNCSCVAYAYDAGAGCMYWSKDLIDIQEFSSGGVDLFLRLPASALAANGKKKVVIIMVTIIGTAMLVSLTYFVWRWLSQSKDKKKNLLETMNYNTSSHPIPFEELPLFELKKLIVATKDFHHSNKLGEGGFGPVFKGKLEDGQEIAVKRLSAASGQGSDEFMNEVVVISKLQHRNLVKLLGCCAEKREKMLIYEYMPNKSLDFILFDPVNKLILNWEKRLNIIEGISRGLVYLHRDSRLRIIHRDLKASNILLDEDLNPKISDFGMARIFSTKQDQDSTRRVVGTYGYMSPEYAMGGHFSEKSDVYSFGVLLLEIVTGRKNNSFWLDEQSLTLLGYVWKLWNDDNVASIIDPVISDPSIRPEILRCIHVGLLCVQEFADDRPSTSTVLSMIVNDIANLPCPKQSGFSRRLVSSDGESSGLGGANTSSTSDYDSITHLSGR